MWRTDKQTNNAVSRVALELQMSVHLSEIYRVFIGCRIFVGGHYKDCIPLNAADQWLILFPIMGDFCT